MNLEELNKSQVVLLTMLVSFVTSIATGIVTVSLIEEAPADVTRVVQRVVERTVEQVAAPAETQQATVITKEKTIVVKESDLIATAIADNNPRVVSVIDTETEGFVALGVFVDSEGTLATDAHALVEGGAYAIDTDAEELLPAVVEYAGGARGIALLKVDAEQVGVSPVAASEGALQLGQTVFSFVGDGTVTQGIVTRLGDGGYMSTSITGIPIAAGAPLLNVDGEVVGLHTGASQEVGESTFAPIRAAFAQAATDPEIATEEATAAQPTETEEEVATSTEETPTE
ncbi:MAG: serine protease [Boseongicola sp.]|nr:serine protease [Boseongicola sp.]